MKIKLNTPIIILPHPRLFSFKKKKNVKHEDTVENGSKRLDFQLSSVHFTGLHSWTSGKSVRGTFCTQKCKVTWPPIGFTWNTRRAHTVNPRAVSTGGTALRKYGPVFHPPLSPPPPRPHSTSFSLSLFLISQKRATRPRVSHLSMTNGLV